MTFYVVIGTTGEYSDRSEWLVKAFSCEETAKKFVEDAGAWARDIYQKHYKNWNTHPRSTGSTYWDSEKEPSPFDPNMQMDYSGTTYSYAPVELVDG